MPTIAENLAAIQNAVYGREVRNAIHNSISQCYSDVAASKTLADTAAGNANNKADLATSAAASANEKAVLANEAASNAHNKAGVADTAAASANEKAGLALAAASNANAAATNAIEKAALASQAAGNATSAAESAYSAAEAAAGISLAAEQIAQTKQLIDGMSVSYENVGPYGTGAVIKTTENGHYNLHFVLKQGEQGPQCAPNQNLLDNWDFRNPVNQRGISTFTVGQYGLDRWMLASGTCEVGSRYITLNGGLVQRIDTDPVAWPANGKPCVLSVELTDGTIKCCDITPSASAPVETSSDTFSALLYNNQTCKEFMISTYVPMQIAAIKLELGTVSTLAQDAPMDYGVELAKCQRYFFKTGSELKYRIAQKSGEYVWFNVSTPVEMRTIPIIQSGYAAAYSLNAETQHPISMSSILINANTRNGIALQVPFNYADGFVILDGVAFLSEL